MRRRDGLFLLWLPDCAIIAEIELGGGAVCMSGDISEYRQGRIRHRLYQERKIARDLMPPSELVWVSLYHL